MSRRQSNARQAATIHDSGRRWSYDGSAFESVAAYARAVRHGNYIAVSGTVDMAADGSAAHPGDAYQQTLEAFHKAIAAVEELGGRRQDIIRTRIFLGHGEDWNATVRAHQELFQGIDPANTSLYVAGFFVPGILVEVEVDAVLDSDARATSQAKPSKTETEGT